MHSRCFDARDGQRPKFLRYLWHLISSSGEPANQPAIKFSIQ
jgi:hypothetical protein